MIILPIKNNLSKLLESKGKSLYWLAQKTGISYPTLHKINKNETDGIKFNILEAICKALGCRIEDLLEIQD